MSAKDMWADISGTENQKLDRVAELFGTVITLAKSNGCSLEEVRSRNRSFQNLPSINTAIDLIEPVYNNYQSMLCSRTWTNGGVFCQTHGPANILYDSTWFKRLTG